jgi:hypothetical protein
MGKESKLGTNEEVWLDTSGWTTSERVDLLLIHEVGEMTNQFKNKRNCLNLVAS